MSFDVLKAFVLGVLEGLTEFLPVRQDTMLAASANAQTTALVESNISSGPVHRLEAGAATVGASATTSWFVFEVAANSDASRVIEPTMQRRNLGNDLQLLNEGAIGGASCGLDRGPVNLPALQNG